MIPSPGPLTPNRAGTPTHSSCSSTPASGIDGASRLGDKLCRPLLLPAALARYILMNMAAPPAKPKCRWMQFSLRTGFIVVTGLCMALSLWVVPAERQRRAVKKVYALGGHAMYVRRNRTPNEGFLMRFLGRWLPPDYFDDVEHADLRNTRVTDAGLAHMKGLKGLQSLDLYGSQATDAGLAGLQGLTSLQMLVLSGTQVTDAGLAHLQGLTHLRLLALDHTPVADAGLVHLRGLTALQELRLTGSPVTDAGLVHLQWLTGLRTLGLNRTQVTDAGVAQLRQALPKCKIIGPRDGDVGWPPSSTK